MISLFEARLHAFYLHKGLRGKKNATAHGVLHVNSHLTLPQGANVQVQNLDFIALKRQHRTVNVKLASLASFTRCHIQTCKIFFSQ